MRLLVLGCLLVTFAIGCSSGVENGTATSEAGRIAAAEAEERLVVFTVNYPLAYFAERIGGDQVEVAFPAPPEVDPADWSPDAEVVAAYQAADLVLLNGADYAKWVARVSLPPSRLIDTSAGFADRLIPLESTVTHTHGPTGEHSHAGWAFTIWLDPTLAGETASAVRDAFTAVRPESEAAFEAGFQALSADLERVDESLAAVVAQIDAPVVFSHPVYQYMIRRYGLEARSVHWEPREQPSEEDWEDLAVLLTGHRAEAMIWESEPLAETRRRLEELGLEVLVYDPSPNRPAEGDWLSVMEANAGRLGSLSSSAAESPSH